MDQLIVTKVREGVPGCVRGIYVDPEMINLIERFLDVFQTSNGDHIDSLIAVADKTLETLETVRLELES
jgi:hypothetical protein